MIINALNSGASTFMADFEILMRQLGKIVWKVKLTLRMRLIEK
jgi:malate synthase